MQRKNFIRRETKQTNGLLWECDDEGRVFSYCKNGESIESMTNLNQQLSSFYNAKAELCREDRKHIEDRKNENKPTKSFETVNEGFYHDRYIRVRRKKNALNKKTNQYAVVRTM